MVLKTANLLGLSFKNECLMESSAKKARAQCSDHMKMKLCAALDEVIHLFYMRQTTLNTLNKNM